MIIRVHFSRADAVYTLDTTNTAYQIYMIASFSFVVEKLNPNGTFSQYALLTTADESITLNPNTGIYRIRLANNATSGTFLLGICSYF